jgi:hypothetical protein
MAKLTGGVERFPAKLKDFVDIIDSLKALKAVYPEGSSPPEVQAAMAELEDLLGSAGVTLRLSTGRRYACSFTLALILMFPGICAACIEELDYPTFVACAKCQSEWSSEAPSKPWTATERITSLTYSK